MTAPWMSYAESMIGTSEIAGPKHSSRILRMWESIKAPFRDDETPWCAAFVGHCLEVGAGIRSTRSASARSYTRWGEPSPLRRGAVVVLSRPGPAWSGHVGFLWGLDTQKRLLILGGNQGDKVCIAAFAADRVVAVRGWPGIELDHAPTVAWGQASSVNEA